MRHVPPLIVALLAVATALCRAVTDDAREATVLYVAHGAGADRVVSQRLSAPVPRTVLRLTDASAVPNRTGLIPSPDGSWLIVWQPDEAAAREGSAPTQWLAVRVSDGRTRLLGTTETASLLPRWKSATQAVLQGDDGSATFDTRKQRLLSPLPRWQGPEEGRRARRERRLLAEWRRDAARSKAFLSVWPRLVADLRVREYDPRPAEPDEYVPLRNVGLPGLDIVRQQEFGGKSRGMARLARAALSPDGTQIAASFVTNVQPSGGWTRADARLEVFSVEADAGALRSLWRALIPAREWKRPPSPAEVPSDAASLPPFTMPEFRDLRFSTDGTYLSYSTIAETGNDDRAAHVVDTRTWKEVARIPGAEGAFVITTAAK